jgi:very-short-patch-repair endonuclease
LLKFPAVTTEYRFHPTRRWRFDVAFLKEKLAVEVEGGVYVQGRHSRGAGLEKDCEKYAEAAILGWTVLRVTPRHVKSGKAAEWIERCLGQLHVR